MRKCKHERAHKRWSSEEIEYLQEGWGNTSIPFLAKQLKRTVTAVTVMAQKLGLGSFLDNNDEYITFHNLTVALGLGGASNSYKKISWVKNRGLKTHRVTRKNQTFEMISVDEFWKWAYENQAFLDFSKFEKYALGPEPEWVSEKRKNDTIRSTKITMLPWSEGEDLRLRRYLKEHKYSYKQLSEMLHRTEGAIQRRILDLKIKERPIKADNHIKWTDDEYFRLGEMIKCGYSYEQMSDFIGKSAKAIRGRVFSMYLTERLDVARKYIGTGSWGDGKPDFPLRHLRLMPMEEKDPAKDMLSRLAFLLKRHAKNISNVNEKFLDFWQKDICQHWDNILGCTAGESDCDSCSSFLRIRVQHCKRCGADFYERKENNFCEACRTARLKQARKKWAILQNKKGI